MTQVLKISPNAIEVDDSSRWQAQTDRCPNSFPFSSLFFFISCVLCHLKLALSPSSTSILCSLGTTPPDSAFQPCRRACSAECVLFPLPVGYVLGCLLIVCFLSEEKLSRPHVFAWDRHEEISSRRAKMYRFGVHVFDVQADEKAGIREQ